MDKTKRRRIILIILVAFICVIFAVGKIFSPERAVLRTFKANEAALNEMVQSYLAGDTAALRTDIPGVQSVQYWHGDNGMIEFFVKGRGIAPASSYFGFYYSVDGAPLAFQNTKVTLIESGDGWKWTHGGDNRGYTEHISGNWYYYEAAF